MNEKPWARLPRDLVRRILELTPGNIRLAFDIIVCNPPRIPVLPKLVFPETKSYHGVHGMQYWRFSYKWDPKNKVVFIMRMNPTSLTIEKRFGGVLWQKQNALMVFSQVKVLYEWEDNNEPSKRVFVYSVNTLGSCPMLPTAPMLNVASEKVQRFVSEDTICSHM